MYRGGIYRVVDESSQVYNHMFTIFNSLYTVAMTSDNWKRVKQRDILLVCHDNDRGYLFCGQYYAQLLDSLGDLFTQRGLRTSTLAKPFSQFVKGKAYGNPYAINRSYLVELTKRKIRQYFMESSTEPAWRTASLWQRLLEKMRPRILVAIQPGQGLCRASKAMSIPVFDLQHGLIDDDSPYYSKKHQGQTDPRFLPSGFLCWDEHNAEILKEWVLSKGLSVHVVGQPWFRRFMIRDPDDALVQDALTRYSVPKCSLPSVLVTLQWGRNLHTWVNVPNQVMPQALEQAILTTAHRYRWMLRLHPIQLLGQEARIALPYVQKTFQGLANVIWAESSSMPLPMAMSSADVHLTYDSAATIEASWMGLRTGLLNPELLPGGKVSSYYAHERTQGRAEVVPQDSDAIIAWIQSALAKGKLPPAFQDFEQNLQDFLDGIHSLPRPAIPA